VTDRHDWNLTLTWKLRSSDRQRNQSDKTGDTTCLVQIGN